MEMNPSMSAVRSYGVAAALLMVTVSALCFFAAIRGTHFAASIIAGIGFIFLAPHALFHPILIREPLRLLFRKPTCSPVAVVWLSGMGILLVAVSFAMRVS